MELVVLGSEDLDAAARRRLRGLWDEAFGHRFDDEDAAHAYGGVHVLAEEGGRLVGHASAIERRIKFGDQPWRKVGYVEAVAVDPTRRGEGIGRSVMEKLHEEIAIRWPVALLSTGHAAAFYALLGWQHWGGRTYTQTATGITLDGNHGGLMVWRPDPSVVPDLSVAVTCEDRPGDAW